MSASIAKPLQVAEIDSLHAVVPYINYTFSPSALYSRTNVSARVKVLGELGAGGGFVTAQGRSTVDMDEIYGFSVYHGLHCIELMRESRFPESKAEADHGSPAHLRHCIEYVRQGIICAADTTLEHASINVSSDGRRSFGFDTSPSSQVWGTSRMCRNLGALTGFSKAYSVATYDGWDG
ncbi:hypothetical protein M409DRAFT_52708 [Zasmidium cellare ATCC 36951]|uniref:Uncharacterized protein n=1 Tax=Zasmidium cellare ATCC 36951 TaxID=1080233 RepID=A0A6A6CRZ0_ZASCE|nr:uncharacterized protein M409DRAFT_52708 [Zasmidium cellare ATCC 36951]KAF2169473.1 hypothetical protein M409DRAFT_52708 [Zasmidium cellare ATCC 36951]